MVVVFDDVFVVVGLSRVASGVETVQHSSHVLMQMVIAKYEFDAYSNYFK